MCLISARACVWAGLRMCIRRGVWRGGKWVVCVRVRVCHCVHWGREWLLCAPASLNPSGRGREREPTHSLRLCARERGCVWAHVSAWTGDDKPSGKGRMISKNSSKMEPQQDGKKRTWTAALLPALDFTEKCSLLEWYVRGFGRKIQPFVNKFK